MSTARPSGSPDLVVIGGAPGSGKSTLSGLLREAWGSPHIDFGWIREVHLDDAWTNQSAAEEAMSFENLAFIVRNYARHGIDRVVVDDLRDFRVQQVPDTFADLSTVIVTLVVSDEAELRRRVSARTEGFRDVERALDWNRAVMGRPAVRNEHKLDAASMSPLELAAEAMRLVALGSDGPG